MKITYKTQDYRTITEDVRTSVYMMLIIMSIVSI